jgi:hypothetical protein
VIVRCGDCGGLWHGADSDCPLPPGPAFIPEPPSRLPWPRADWEAENVPDGYVWQPATNSTGAGWVRPQEKTDARHR